MVRPATPDDADAILALAQASAMFDPAGLAQIEDTFAQAADQDALWSIADDGGPVGVVYCAPEPMTDQTWNVLMLLVGDDHHGQGHGRALMEHVESAAAERGGRLLIVETSGLDAFARARAFYHACGYREEARVRDFYAAGDDKVVFATSLSPSGRPG